MFSKIDKKILWFLILALAFVSLTGFAVYKYALAPVSVENTAGGAQSEQPAAQNQKPAANTPEIQIETAPVQQIGGSAGTLTFCVDKCGDGICQTTDPSCKKGDNLNCLCLESPKDCPQDCK